MPGVIDDIKRIFHRKDPEATGDHPAQHVTETAQEEHALAEAQADELIHEREEEEATEPAQPWTPPTVTNGREPLAVEAQRAELESVVRSASVHGKKPPPDTEKDLEELEEGAKVPKEALPDLEGVTHIPESELVPRLDRTEHTGLRPSDPFDPKSMDGLPNPTSAGDDYAI